jgi:hypothetical protein
LAGCRWGLPCFRCKVAYRLTGLHEPGLLEPGLNEPGLNEPGLNEPRLNEPGLPGPLGPGPGSTSITLGRSGPAGLGAKPVGWGQG